MGDMVQLQEDECFISDLGENKEVQIENQKVIMGRYAVIKKHEGQLQILEVGSNLERLMKKYHISAGRLGMVVR